MTDGNEPRFMRIAYECQVEVTDPVAASAYTMDLSQGANGEMGMLSFASQDEQMRVLLMRIISHALDTEGPKAGFKWIGGSVFPSPLNESD